MKILLALGANLHSEWGKPAKTLSRAVALLSERIGPIVHQSRQFATPAFPAGSGPDFVNAALALESVLSPDQILAICHELEAAARRERDQRWGPRTLDVDLLACGQLVLPDTATFQSWHDLPAESQLTETPTQLILPHPRLHERAFVLVPLADVAPDWRHPVLDVTVAEMLAWLPDAEKDAVIPLQSR